MERKDLAPYMSFDEHRTMAESNKSYYRANWTIFGCVALLLIAGITTTVYWAHPLIIKVENWQIILLPGCASTLFLLLLMTIQRRKAKVAIRTMLIKAVFKAQKNGVK